ncbi:hypothetical protein [Thermomonas sp. S9]|uniref:hypothetical protein n=1 Tax=Thermomonas sp. S9 TaxID=2885203 RepID=UPI00216AFC5E|nr:hypothetical protein [Thermomonas sp. S9]
MRLQGELVLVVRLAALAQQIVAAMVVHRQHQELAVEFVLRMILEREHVPGREGAHAAAPAVAQVAGFLGLHHDVGQVAARGGAALGIEAAGIAVALQVDVGAEPEHARGFLAQHADFQVVPVGQGGLAGAHLAVAGDVQDGIDLVGLGVAAERDPLRLQRTVAVLVVGQYQQVPALVVVVVAEVVMDAFPLQQARDEGEAGLVVLRAVIQLRVLAIQFQPVVAVVELGENGLDDVGHRLALEDAAVLVLGEEPEPRHQIAFVAVQILAAAVGGLHDAGVGKA